MIERVILAVDGIEGLSDFVSEEEVDFDQWIIGRINRGYVFNIANALKAVESPFIFWLEDDWDFSRDIPISKMLNVIQSDPSITQVHLSKRAKLLREDCNFGSAADGFFLHGARYTFNPHVARRAFVTAAVESIKAGRHAGRNVEWAFSSEMRREGLKAAVVDPSTCMCIHRGMRVDSYDDHRIPDSWLDPTSTCDQSACSEGAGELPASAVRLSGPRTGGRAARVASALAMAGFAALVGLLSIPGIVVSRQVRAFVRSVWAYWWGQGDNPAINAPTRHDHE